MRGVLLCGYFRRQQHPAAKKSRGFFSHYERWNFFVEAHFVTTDFSMWNLSDKRAKISLVGFWGYHFLFGDDCEHERPGEPR